MLMYDQIRTAPLAFPPAVPASPALVALLSRMLAKDPAHRLSLPQILSHPWVTHGCSAPLPGSLQVRAEATGAPSKFPQVSSALHAPDSILWSPLGRRRQYVYISHGNSAHCTITVALTR